MGIAHSVLNSGLTDFESRVGMAYVVLAKEPQTPVTECTSVNVIVDTPSPFIPAVAVKVYPETSPKVLQKESYGEVYVTVNRFNSLSTPNAIICRNVNVYVVEETSPEMVVQLRGEGFVDTGFIEVTCEQLVIEEEVNLSAALRKLTCRINAHQYTEIELDLGDIDIEEVIGLPSGMLFDGYKIKGTPKTGGEYGIALKLMNGTSVTGAIHVSPLQRVK